MPIFIGALQRRIDIVEPGPQSRLSELHRDIRTLVADFVFAKQGTTSEAVKAAQTGDVTELSRLAEGGADLTARDEYGRTPLKAAIEAARSDTPEVQDAVNWLFKEIHQLDSTSLGFQRDVLRQIQNLSGEEERAHVLQRLAYEHSQVLLDRRATQQFASGMEGRNIDSLVDEFQTASAEGWSLLNLVSEMNTLDPYQTPPMLGLDEIRDRIASLRDRIKKDPAQFANVQKEIAKGQLHEFDRRLLVLVARYESGQPDLSDREQAGLKLLYEQLLGDVYTPLAARPLLSTGAAAAAASAVPASPFTGAGLALGTGNSANSNGGTGSQETHRTRFLAALEKRQR